MFPLSFAFERSWTIVVITETRLCIRPKQAYIVEYTEQAVTHVTDDGHLSLR